MDYFDVAKGGRGRLLPEACDGQEKSFATSCQAWTSSESSGTPRPNGYRYNRLCIGLSTETH